MTGLLPTRTGAGHDTGDRAPARAVRTVLDESRAVVEPGLRAAVATLDPATGRWCAHHLGLVDAEGRPTRGAGGKGVRGALALLGGRVVGADDHDTGPAAVAVELVHEFSLVHDDLMDGDTQRRHRPTVWARFGTSEAVLAGDALATLAQETVLASSSSCRADAAALLARTVRALVAGQTEDLAFEGLPATEIGPARCRAMVAGKTGSLLATAASIGALLAGADHDEVDALATFGHELGIAFQLVDDVLGIWGDPAVTGKPVGSDLRAGKKTLPIVQAVTHGEAAGRELARELAAPPEQRDPEHLAALVDRAGGRRWALDEARRCRLRAERALARVPASRSPATEPACTELLALGRLLADRES